MPRRKVQHACGVAWRARSSTDDAPLRQDDVKGRNLQVALRYADEAQRALRPKGAQIVSPGKVGRHGDENEVKGACCSLQLVRVFGCNKSGRAELPRFSILRMGRRDCGIRARVQSWLGRMPISLSSIWPSVDGSTRHHCIQ